MTMTILDGIVDKELAMDMTDRSVKSKMEFLFTNYISMLRRHGISWMISSN